MIEKDKKPNKWTRALLMVRNVSFFICLAILTYRFWLFETEEYVVSLPEDTTIYAIEGIAPTQTFTNPVAQRLVDIGRDLVENPHERRAAARQLHAISINPDLIGDDQTTYLALRAAYWQLRRDPRLEGSKDVALLIWDAAEQIEAANHHMARAETATE